MAIHFLETDLVVHSFMLDHRKTRLGTRTENRRKEFFYSPGMIPDAWKVPGPDTCKHLNSKQQSNIFSKSGRVRARPGPDSMNRHVQCHDILALSKLYDDVCHQTVILRRYNIVFNRYCVTNYYLYDIYLGN